MAPPAAMCIRPYQPDDHGQVMALAPRLAEGVAPWRDPESVLAAARDWVRESVAAVSRPGHAVFVAAGGDRIGGVVTVSEQAHFSGQAQAYVGELAVRPGWERRGIATRLMAAAEAWVRARGLPFLTLQTGAANQPARLFYAALGYREEEVTLTRPLPAADRRAS